LYLLGLMSYSFVYPIIKYYGTLRGAKMACKRFFGPETDNCKYLILEYDKYMDLVYDKYMEFFAVEYEYSWRD